MIPFRSAAKDPFNSDKYAYNIMFHRVNTSPPHYNTRIEYHYIPCYLSTPPVYSSYNVRAQLCVLLYILIIKMEHIIYNPTINSMHNVSMLLKQSNVCGWTYNNRISVRILSAYTEVAHYLQALSSATQKLLCSLPSRPH